MENVYFYNTAIGKIGIAATEHHITRIILGDESISKDYEEKETPLIRKAIAQIKEYLEGERKVFDLPLKAEGTEFQKKVWDALKKIPYGETRSYGEIAKSIGHPKAYRAVGNSNNKNPLGIVVPCHRVIGADGKMVGYAGGIDIKSKLLKMEEENSI